MTCYDSLLTVGFRDWNFFICVCGKMLNLALEMTKDMPVMKSAYPKGLHVQPPDEPRKTNERDELLSFVSSKLWNHLAVELGFLKNKTFIAFGLTWQFYQEVFGNEHVKSNSHQTKLYSSWKALKFKPLLPEDVETQNKTKSEKHLESTTHLTSYITFLFTAKCLTQGHFDEWTQKELEIKLTTLQLVDDNSTSWSTGSRMDTGSLKISSPLCLRMMLVWQYRNRNESEMRITKMKTSSYFTAWWDFFCMDGENGPKKGNKSRTQVKLSNLCTRFRFFLVPHGTAQVLILVALERNRRTVTKVSFLFRLGDINKWWEEDFSDISSWLFKWV